MRRWDWIRHPHKCPVYFEQKFDAFEFPAVDLETPIPTSNPSILATVLEHLISLEREKGSEDICSRTRTFIRQRLGTRMCNLTSASSYLGLHPKALQRELLTNAVTFQAMLVDERQDVAVYCLEHSDLNLKQLPSMLGYSDPASFTRAFKNAAACHHGVGGQTIAYHPCNSTWDLFLQARRLREPLSVSLVDSQVR